MVNHQFQLHEVSFDSSSISVAGLANQAFVDRKYHSGSPIIVMVHGYLDNANSFAPILSCCNKYPAIAIDLAGHGKSRHRSKDAHYHLVDYAYDLSQFVRTLADKHQVNNLILVGHSLGGIVSSIYASTQVKILKGLMLIESIGPLSESEETTAQQIAACFESRERAQKAIKQPSSIASLVAARCAISDLQAEHAELLLLRNIAMDSANELTWRTDKRLRTKSTIRMTEAQAQNILANISCPTTLILGQHGFEKVKKILSQRKALFEKIPNKVFKGGHHVHMEQAELIAQEIDDWVNLCMNTDHKSNNDKE